MAALRGSPAVAQEHDGATCHVIVRGRRRQCALLSHMRGVTKEHGWLLALPAQDCAGRAGAGCG
eukprot:3549123-Alexandrium_andersonii.AAC.1